MPPKPKKGTGPSMFCEWIVSTSIPSALGPVPQPKPKPKPKPKRRDVMKFEVTTDDESETDTVSITYPRTGRCVSPADTADDTSSSEAVVKKVRFEEDAKPAPMKSALKKRTVTFSESDVSSDTETDLESESSQSAKTSDSEAESSDDSTRPLRAKKHRKKKRTISDTETDTESEYDSEVPHPTCKCASCAWGRSKMSKHCLKQFQSGSDSNTETSDSGTDTSSAKDKKQNKKAKVSDSETEASESEKETSESEPEKPAKKETPPAKAKNQPKKKEAKKAELKSEDSETAAEISESEAETPPPKAKDKKASQKSESNKEKTAPAKKKEQKKGQKQPKKQKKEIDEIADADADADDEAEESAEETLSKKKKKKTQADKEKKTQPEKAKKAEPEKSKPKRKAEKKKNSQPEALPQPDTRRPNFIQPVRAEVVQAERVVETPHDPPPNAYYDPTHNVMRVYYGPAYGNHHGHALYPSRTTEIAPLPVGTPHPTQNPYMYGFQNQPMPPPAGYGYNNVPVTQGMPVAAYNAVVPPPAFPPGHPMAHVAPGQDGNPYVMSGALPVPASSKSKDKDKDGENNVGPESSKGPKNPYYNPSRPRSQFSAYGSARRHDNQDGRPASAKDDTRPPSNEAWGNNDGAGDQQGTWDTHNHGTNDWGGQDNQQQSNNSWNAGSNRGSQQSNGSQKKQGDHWGSDTFLGQNSYGNYRETSENNVGWDNDSKDKGSGMPKSNIMPGTWVDTAPTPAPAPDEANPPWGDPTAAQDTYGEAANW